ncbi:FAD-binding oxidoreductase [Mesorhizobium sp. WSM4305]|nr:FAD-binding oxidoreductase [Mesorhizobium sp. WSM4305]
MIFTGSVNPASATAARSSWDPAFRSGRRASRAKNVIHAFGNGHQVLIGGAVTGKIVSQLAAGLPPTIDLTPFRADRF